MRQDTRHERNLLLAPKARLGAIARFFGNLIGVKYGDPFVLKETMRLDDITAMGVRSL